MTDSQYETLLKINLDDLVSSFGWENKPILPRVLQRIFLRPAKTFAHQMMEFDQEVGRSGLVEGARYALRKYFNYIPFFGVENLPKSGFLALSNHPGMSDSLSTFIALNRPDLKIIALQRPRQQVTHQVSADHLSTRVVLLTGYDDIEQAIHAILAGATGYCAKDIEPEVLTRTIRAVAEGRYAVSGNIFNRRELDRWIDDQMEGARRSYSEPGAPFHPLSDREMEVLSCVVRGMSNKEIATLLGISHQTAKNHVTSILRKFGVEDRTQAVVYALKRGWVKLQTPVAKGQE